MRMLLTGGGKSGKSTAAQHLCRHLAAGGPMYYWATMTPRDSEIQGLAGLAASAKTLVESDKAE